MSSATKLHTSHTAGHRLLAVALLLITASLVSAATWRQRGSASRMLRRPVNAVEVRDTVAPRPLTAAEILDTITLRRPSDNNLPYAALLAPWVMNGYRHISRHEFKPAPLPPLETIVYSGEEAPDSVEAPHCAPAGRYPGDGFPAPLSFDEELPALNAFRSSSQPTVPWSMPESILRTDAALRLTADIMHTVMVNHPRSTEYLYWTLPEPPVLAPDDQSFAGFLKRMQLPDVDVSKAEIEAAEIDKRHWLHVFKAGLHFSQAYVSPNWYQGGNNYLALLINFFWDVSLNQVYHPNLMYQNTVSYKLGLNSNPKGQLHKYNISEDIFQWNMKAGVKAFKHWFYSFTLQFKTQMLLNFAEDSWTRTASFLSPGDLNLGLGMTYSIANKNNTLKFNASVSPVSYNLKTCIDRKIDPTQFNIRAGRRFNNEIGSNAELTLDWKWASNIAYRSRLFLFSNYKYFLTDWENTISFNINKFLSTQIYVHLRYDTSADSPDSRWRHLQLKEILSFGFSYAFSTK